MSRPRLAPKVRTLFPRSSRSRCRRIWYLCRTLVVVFACLSRCLAREHVWIVRRRRRKWNCFRVWDDRVGLRRMLICRSWVQSCSGTRWRVPIYTIGSMVIVWHGSPGRKRWIGWRSWSMICLGNRKKGDERTHPLWAESDFICCSITVVSVVL